jgi:hypothetical protein
VAHTKAVHQQRMRRTANAPDLPALPLGPLHEPRTDRILRRDHARVDRHHLQRLHPKGEIDVSGPIRFIKGMADKGNRVTGLV